jgi:pimeloyl-ACP methyl ester carboxylesterase
MSRSDEFVTVDGIEIHYSAWGNSADPPVLCVHGLSRNGRDFDPLARDLQDDYHVICPDIPGRGWSEWADEPAERYTNAALVETLVGFCDALELESLRYVGTSMGGGLGMALAGGPLADRIERLVVNDVPPNPEADAEPEAMGRIVEYVPNPPTVGTLSELEDYFRDLYEGRFSEMTDDEYRRLTMTSARRTGDGDFAPAYDPEILVSGEDDGPDPWDVWAAIDVPILLFRGTDSDILPADAYERMLDVQPDAETVEIDCGHAPALNTPEQIEPIREFFA